MPDFNVLTVVLTSGAKYRLVPTLLLGTISTVSVAESYLTARPRSAMAQVPFDLTRIFLLFKSLCAMAGFPERKKTISQLQGLWNSRDFPQEPATS